MPAVGKEQALLLRRFRGVNIAIDSAFVDPDFLQSSRNFVPETTYLLSKRHGTRFFGGPLVNDGRIDVMQAVYDATGTLFLFYVVSSGSGDRIEFADVTGTSHAVTNGTFPSAGRRYDMSVLGGDLYVGNGVDPIKQIPVTNPTTAVDLVPYALADDTGQTSTTVADPNSILLNGTYSYRWAIFNSTSKRWDAVGPVQTIVLSGVDDLVFTAPTVAGGVVDPSGATVPLAPDQKWHLFVAVANAAIETATDQKSDGFVAAESFTMASITVDGLPVPVPSSVMRSGRFFVTHLNRVWFAVGSRVFATDVLVPGLEQQIFDAGSFFPADATFTVEDDGGGNITALFVATVTATNDSPSAPVIITTENAMWGWFGDILNDPSANRVKLSGRVGCIAQATAVPTPVGTIFCGLDSVYLIRPDVLVPQDIGWPIAPSIKSIPEGRRPFACAYYHKGFYKLAITLPGGALNTIEWWLDLRNAVRTGQLDPTPSWWGPHIAMPVSALTVGLEDPHEFDRGFGAAEGALPPTASGGLIFLMDQTNVFTEGAYPFFAGTTIVSQILTKAIDAGQPFDDKIVTRVRANGKVTILTHVPLSVIVDDVGFAGFFSSVNGLSELTFPAPTGAIWTEGVPLAPTVPAFQHQWNTATWSIAQLDEALAFAPAGRPRGRQITIRAEHRQASDVELRDFELAYLPVVRPVPTFPAT